MERYRIADEAGPNTPRWTCYLLYPIGEGRLYIVKAVNHAGQIGVVCGTPEQALDKADELMARGYKDVKIRNLNKVEWEARAFAGRHGLD